MKKIVFLMMAIMIAIQSSAQWDGTSAPWTQGSGTESNPYLIESPQHLAYLSDMVCAGVNDYSGKHFLLTQDISLSNQSWMPIGDENHPYKGNFDGGGHTIDSMYINGNYTYSGLFGYVENSSVCHLVLYGQNNGSSSYSGGVVGKCFRDCFISYVINNCSVSTGASSWTNIGGIVGCHGTDDTTKMTIISNCINNGTISLSSYGSLTISHISAGGIIGEADKVNILRCSNNGSVMINTGGSTISYYIYSGGVVGRLYNESMCSINICNNTAPVYIYSSSGGSYNKTGGGIIGYVYKPSKLLLNYCYNTGNITVLPTNYNCRIASGIYYCNGSGYANNSYNVGTLNSYSAYGTALSGGTNSYYLDVCGAIAGGSPRTESQMKSISFPIILNTDSTVFVMDQTNANDGYPVFWFTVAYDITTDTATNITSYNAELNGHYGGVADTVGFIYGLNNNNTAMTQIISGETTSPVSLVLTGLQPNAQYRYTFFVKHNGTYIYGDTLTFTTKPTYSISLSSNNNAWGSVSGGGVYGYGDTATLTATAVNHYQFSQWSDGNTDNPRTITVFSDTSLTAFFEVEQYTISVSVNNSAWGSATGAGVYDYWSPAILTAVPNVGYHYKQWSSPSGNWHYEENPFLISHVVATVEYICEFEPNQYTVTVLANDNTMGIVSGGGSYNYGQQIYIIAQPIGNYIFTQWSDGETSAYRLLTVTGNITYTAIFTDAIFNITAQSNNASFGTVTGSGSYARGSQVQLTAIPNEGYHFTQWNDGNTENPRTITVNADATYTAQFAANTYVVNVSSSNSSMGSATGGGIFSYGQQITIEATPMPHYRFVQWNDGVNSNPRVVTITSDTTFTAMFEQMPQYTITVVSADETKGSVSGGGTFYGGEQTVISATASSGNVFDRWSDGNTEAIRTITVTSDATYTAYFSGVRCTVNVYSNDDNMGTVSGGGEYEQGAQATVTATPANGCRFVRWNNGVEQNPYTFTVYSNVNLIANFERFSGIDDAVKNKYSILSKGLDIIIDGAENEPVIISNVLGQRMYVSSKYNGEQLKMPITGVYFVKIGVNPAIKIVLIH